MGQLNRDDGCEALTQIVSGDRDLLALGVGFPLSLDIAVDGSGQRRSETDQMASALDCIDVVRERVDRFVVGIVVLDRDFDCDFATSPFREGAFIRNENGLFVKWGARSVQVLNEGDDSALVTEIVFFIVVLVLDDDADAGIEKREFPQPLGERVEGKLRARKDLGVGVEGDGRPGFCRFSRILERSLGHAAFIGLPPDFIFAADLEIEPDGKRVDNRDADAVQTP